MSCQFGGDKKMNKKQYDILFYVVSGAFIGFGCAAMGLGILFNFVLA